MSRMLDEVREEAEQKEVTEEMTKKRKMLISVGVVLVAAIVVFALIISRAEWIQTDMEHYLPGQEVTVHFSNPTLRIIDRGSWGIEGIHYREWVPLGVVRIVPGQTFTWTWDQTQHGPPYDPQASPTRVPPGTYTVWWEPTDLKTGEPIGRFTYEFEIVEGSELRPALTPAGENGYLCREGLPSVQARYL